MLSIAIGYPRGDELANEAVNLEIDLLNQFESEIEQIALVPHPEKEFTVDVDGQLIYSMQDSSRPYRPQEITGMIQYLIHRGHL